MRLDFFEVDDAVLFMGDYSDYITPQFHRGYLDEYEYKAVIPFFDSCQKFGLETNIYEVKIYSHALPSVHSHLLVYPFPDNRWHQEVREKLSLILQRTLETGKGLVAQA